MELKITYQTTLTHQEYYNFIVDYQGDKKKMIFFYTK
jgi:hypothetical protein